MSDIAPEAGPEAVAPVPTVVVDEFVHPSDPENDLNGMVSVVHLFYGFARDVELAQVIVDVRVTRAARVLGSAVAGFVQECCNDNRGNLRRPKEAVDPKGLCATVGRLKRWAETTDSPLVLPYEWLQLAGIYAGAVVDVIKNRDIDDGVGQSCSVNHGDGTLDRWDPNYTGPDKPLYNQLW